MLRTVYIASCPRCGDKPAIYAIKGDEPKGGIACNRQGCQVETGWTSETLEVLLWRWNNGIGLQRLGKPYGYADVKRDIHAMRVFV